MTWGILVAVGGIALAFPALIVSFAGGIDPLEVVRLALTDADEYSRQLRSCHGVIASFGGMFLLMVFLQFVCDEAKDVHWIGPIERRLSTLGKMEAVEVAIALAVLLTLPSASLVAGLLGLLSFVGIKGVLGLCGDGEDPASCIAGKKGLTGFIYLEVLDASFSLDGVLGAFALTDNPLLIMVWLGIGAAVIRTLTVRLVRNGTLAQFIYLEHGCIWGSVPSRSSCSVARPGTCLRSLPG